jgi:hypothetical protein
MGRRDFIQNISRVTLLGGVISISGFLLLKRTIKPSKDCSYSSVCKRCEKFHSCDKVTEQKPLAYGKEIRK